MPIPKPVLSSISQVALLVLLIASCAMPAHAFAGRGSIPCSGVTGSSMSIIVLADSLAGISPGQSVRVMAESACVGEATYDGENFSVSVWGSDPVDDNGLDEGDPLSLVVAETGTPLSGMYEDYFGGGLSYLTYAPNAVLLSHRLTVFSSEVGFTSAGTSIAQGEEAAAAVRLQHTGSVALAGFQLDLLGEGVGFDEVLAGTAVSGSSWSFSVAPIEGGVRVLAVNPGGGLAEGSHPILNLVLSTLTGGEVQIANAIGTLADDAGTDAELGIGQGTFAVSVAPRGDVNDDGSVNIADFVATIDVVLEVSDYNDEADLYPFPAGDDLVDVRDLNVLGRAILAGEWPDGGPVGTGLGRGSSRFVQRGDKSVQSDEETVQGGQETGILYLHSVGDRYHMGADVTLRAIQGVAATAGEIVGLEGATVVTQEEAGAVNFLVYSFSTNPLPTLFAEGPGDLGPETLTDLVGVTMQGETVPLTVAFATAGEGGPEESVAFEIFPNPTRGAVRFTRPSSGTVYDVLGRHVLEFEEASRLDMNGLRAGAYYVRTQDGTFPLTVVR